MFDLCDEERSELQWQEKMVEQEQPHGSSRKGNCVHHSNMLGLGAVQEFLDILPTMWHHVKFTDI